jgi:FixJ family two-component response regulator
MEMVSVIQPIVYIVDDDDAVRESLKALFQSVGMVVETFASAGEFLASLDGPRVGCLLVDVRMPGLSGLELQAKLTERQVNLPVIVITGHGNVEMVVRAMKAGAKDFIEKPFNEQLLLERVQTCLDESQLAQQELDRLRIVKVRLGQLTTREREVLDFLVQGKPSKLIASKLGISPKTVDVHRSRVMEKIGVKSLAELIRLVVRLEQRGEF